MKKLLFLIITVLSIQLISSQQLDQKTAIQLNVKLKKVNNAYKASDFSKALQIVKEIEEIVGENSFPDVQNWKVKALLGLDRFQEAKQQLAILYTLNPDDTVQEDIAKYEDLIDNGIKAEQQRKENLRLAELERKRKAEQAELERKRKAQLAELKRQREAELAREIKRKKEIEKNRLLEASKYFYPKMNNGQMQLDSKGKPLFEYKGTQNLTREEKELVLRKYYEEIKDRLNRNIVLNLTKEKLKEKYTQRKKSLEEQGYTNLKYVPVRTKLFKFSFLYSWYRSSYSEEDIGYINKNGEFLKYYWDFDDYYSRRKGNFLRPFIGNYALVSGGYFLKIDGTVIKIKNYYPSQLTEDRAVFGNCIYDLNGKEHGCYEQVGKFGNGLFPVKKYIPNPMRDIDGSIGNYYWGYADKNAKLVIPFKYVYATSFKNGEAAVCERGKGCSLKKRNRKSHIINTKGEKLRNYRFKRDGFRFIHYRKKDFYGPTED